jgi:signal transduction histidine kinase
VQRVRFDDSLRTVLAADASTDFGAASAWRQIVDLIGRGRAPATPEALARLRTLRNRVPERTRAASARALAFAEPGAELVRLFGEDVPAVAAPVLGPARLEGDAWAAIVPALSPAGRAVLRNRRDLPVEAERALASYGSVDFVLPNAAAPRVEAMREPDPEPNPEPPMVAPPGTPLADTPFVALGAVARELPVVAEALRRADPDGDAAPEPPRRYEIADLVARIDAYQRRRVAPAAPPAPPAERFEFQTDAAGAIRWVEGAARGPLIGVTLAEGGAGAAVDGVAAGAFRRRSAFRDARLTVAGTSDAAGAWRLAASPRFDPDTGRFIGYRGHARRPRADEAPGRPRGLEPLRQLVHELRTPANAIQGFAELIEAELLGPVGGAYRDRAVLIRQHAADLVQAIEDLDTAARIDAGALELRPGAVPVAALLARVEGDLRPLAELRGATLAVAPVAPGLAIAGDDRAVERLVGRLLAALVSAGGDGERIAVTVSVDGERVAIACDRPAALAGLAEEALLSIDAEAEAEAELRGAPLLGTNFALRLARNLAGELGGALAIDAHALTLRLPAVSNRDMGQASLH